MSEVLTDIFSLYAFSEVLHVKVKGHNLDTYSGCFPMIENLILCKKIVVEKNGVQHYQLESVCSELSDMIDYITDARLYEETGIHDELKDRNGITARNPLYADNTITARSLLYADVARDADLYFSPHPAREKVLSRSVSSYINATATTIIEYFDQRFTESESGRTSNIETKIPPIIEHVLYFSQAQNKSIGDSIKEIRNSRNARLFRQYVSDLDSEIKDLSPRKRISVYQPLFRDIDKLCNTWATDMNDETRYRQRRINLSKIPIVGRFLEALGTGQLDIKDPILFSGTPHLLFVNDLYRK